MIKSNIIVGKRASSNFLRKAGTLIDVEKNLYKVYENVLGITFGEWKSIPHINYVLLFKTLYIKCEGCSPEDFENGHGAIYQLSLVYAKNRKIIVHETKNKDDIFLLANKLSLVFNVKTRDAASDRRNPKWLL